MNFSNWQIERIGIGITALSLFLSLFIVFLALPPFHTGVWFQSEPVIIGLHIVSAIACAGVTLLILSNRTRYFYIIKHPFVLFPAFLGIWSVLVSPFASVPVLSWLGYPCQGEGILWYFDLASLIAAGIGVNEYSGIRRGIAWISTAAAWTVTGLTIYGNFRHPAWQWSPYWFPDYIAFYGIFAIIILTTYIRPDSFMAQAGCLSAGGGIVVLSDNRAAILLSLILIPLTWGMLSYLRQRQKRFVRLYAAGPIIAIPIFLTVGISLYEIHRTETHPKKQIQSDSLSSRSLQNRVIFLSFQDKPSALFTGYGWGHYADQLIAYANQDAVFLNAEGPERLDSLDREYFHSHNDFAEALLSSGVIGMLLLWGLLISLPFCCKDSQIALAGTSAVLTAGLSAVWFQLPGSLPFMALAFAGFQNRKEEYKVPLSGFAAGTVILISVFLIQIYAVTITCYQSIKVRNIVLEKISYPDKMLSLTSDDLVAYAGPGGVHFTRIFLRMLVNARINHGRDISSLLFKFFNAQEQLFQSDKKMSLRFYSSGILARGELAFSISHPDFLKYFADWREQLDLFLKLAPHRTDMASLYLLWLFREQKEVEMLDIANQIFEKDSKDPVGLFFSGLALAAKPDGKEIGLKRMRESIDRGIERIMPLDSQLKQQILSATAGY